MRLALMSFLPQYHAIHSMGALWQRHIHLTQQDKGPWRWLLIALSDSADRQQRYQV